MTEPPSHSHDDATTPVGFSTMCPQCGVMLDALTTSCGACGAVITGEGSSGERAQEARNAELRQQVADARRIALEAESKLEALSKARAPKAAAASAPLVTPKRVAAAHLFVMARGVTPSVIVDGVDLAPSDTQQVIFLSRRVAMQKALKRAQGIRLRSAQRPLPP